MKDYVSFTQLFIHPLLSENTDAIFVSHCDLFILQVISCCYVVWFTYTVPTTPVTSISIMSSSPRRLKHDNFFLEGPVTNQSPQVNAACCNVEGTGCAGLALGVTHQVTRAQVKSPSSTGQLCETTVQTQWSTEVIQTTVWIWAVMHLVLTGLCCLYMYSPPSLSNLLLSKHIICSIH